MRPAQHLHFLSYPVAHECQGNARGGNVQGECPFPGGKCSFPAVLVLSTEIVAIDPVYYTYDDRARHGHCDEKYRVD